MRSMTSASQADKHWRYALIPDDAIQPNATLDGLLGSFTKSADLELLGGLELTAG